MHPRSRYHRRWIWLAALILLLIGLGYFLIGECAYTAGMGAIQQTCDCWGVEWELYDRTPADGPRKTVCLGVRRSVACFQYPQGPQVACEGVPVPTGE